MDAPWITGAQGPSAEYLRRAERADVLQERADEQKLREEDAWIPGLLADAIEHRNWLIGFVRNALSVPLSEPEREAVVYDLFRHTLLLVDAHLVRHHVHLRSEQVTGRRELDLALEARTSLPTKKDGLPLELTEAMIETDRDLGGALSGEGREAQALDLLRAAHRAEARLGRATEAPDRADLVHALWCRYTSLKELQPPGTREPADEISAVVGEGLEHASELLDAARAGSEEALDVLPLLADLHAHRSGGHPGPDTDSAISALEMFLSGRSEPGARRIQMSFELGLLLDQRIPEASTAQEHGLTDKELADTTAAVIVFEELLRRPAKELADALAAPEASAMVGVFLARWYWVESQAVQDPARMGRMVELAENTLDSDLPSDTVDDARRFFVAATMRWVSLTGVETDAVAVRRIERSLAILRDLEPSGSSQSAVDPPAGDMSAPVPSDISQDRALCSSLIALCLTALAQATDDPGEATARDLHEALERWSGVLDLGLPPEQRDEALGYLGLTVIAGHRMQVLGWEECERVLPMLEGVAINAVSGGVRETVALARGVLRIQSAATLRDDDLLDLGIEDLRVVRHERDGGRRLMATNALSSALLTRYFQRGDLADLRAVERIIDEFTTELSADPALAANFDGNPTAGLRVQLYLARALSEQARSGQWRPMAPDRIDEIRRELETTPKWSPDRFLLLSELGFALGLDDLHTGALGPRSKSLGMLLEAARSWPERGQGVQSDLARMRASTLLVAALHLNGEQVEPFERVAMANEAHGWLTSLATTGAPSVAERALALSAMLSRLSSSPGWNDPGSLTEAIGRMEQARERVPLSHPTAQVQRRALSDMYWQRSQRWGRDDRERARTAALESLYASCHQVLLQPTVEQAVGRAREATGFATVLAHRELSDGRLWEAVRALEVGRGLILHATTSSETVERLLEQAGETNLARRWRGLAQRRGRVTLVEQDPVSEALLSPAQEGDGAGIPDDLRHRVVRLMEENEALRDELWEPPSVGRIAAALRRTGRDALVYLIPAPAYGGSGALTGFALVVGANGALRYEPLPGLTDNEDGYAHRLLRAQRDLARAKGVLHGQAVNEFNELLPQAMRWTGRTVLDPLLASEALGVVDGMPNLVLVPSGRLGVLPWAAATLPPRGKRLRSCPAVKEVVISTAATARQFVAVSRRLPCDPQARPVLVQDPTGTLEGAAAEVKALTSAFYPHGEVLGPGRSVSGTPGDVLERLAPPGNGGGSLVHFSAHVLASGSPERSFIALAGGLLPLKRLLERAVKAPVHNGDTTDPQGALVVMMSCAADVPLERHDEMLTLATGFLAIGAATTIGSRWPVPDRTAPMFAHRLHHHLVVEGLRPAKALRAAQLWMADPNREFLDSLPEELRLAPGADDLRCWAAFGHQGW